jgi:hypothetical protein
VPLCTISISQKLGYLFPLSWNRHLIGLDSTRLGYSTVEYICYMYSNHIKNIWSVCLFPWNYLQSCFHQNSLSSNSQHRHTMRLDSLSLCYCNLIFSLCTALKDRLLPWNDAHSCFPENYLSSSSQHRHPMRLDSPSLCYCSLIILLHLHHSHPLICSFFSCGHEIIFSPKVYFFLLPE